MGGGKSHGKPVSPRGAQGHLVGVLKRTSHVMAQSGGVELRHDAVFKFWHQGCACLAYLSLLSQVWCSLQPQPQEAAGRGETLALAPGNTRKQGTVLTANEFCPLFIVGMPINQGHCYFYRCLAVYSRQFSDQG